MTFVKQGNEMRYSEVTALVDELVKKKVLVNLEDHEVKTFFVKLYNWQLDDLCRWVRRAGYDVKNINKMLDAAYMHKLISNKQVWHEGGEIALSIKEQNDITKDEIIEFIIDKWLKEMKADRAAITAKEEKLMAEEVYDQEV